MEYEPSKVKEQLKKCELVKPGRYDNELTCMIPYYCQRLHVLPLYYNEKITGHGMKVFVCTNFTTHPMTEVENKSIKFNAKLSIHYKWNAHAHRPTATSKIINLYL